MTGAHTKPGEPRWSSTGARIRRGAIGAPGAARLETITLENSRARITLAPSKGAEIVEFIDKSLDIDFCSYSDRGPLAAVPAGSRASDGVASFHDGYSGGWQQVFPNGGAPSSYRGATLGQHAEAAGIPWTAEILLDTPAAVTVRFSVELVRVPFRLERVATLRADSSRVEFTESASNYSPVSVHAMWGQHLTFGRPFLHAGCRITLPQGVHVTPHDGLAVDEIRRGHDYDWPHADLTEGGTVDLSVVPEDDAPSEMAYLHGFDEGWYELDSDRSGGRIRVEWDAKQLPYLWMWREFGASHDYPFWGTVYALGLEPFSSMPTNGLATAVQNGTALTFLGGESKAFEWTVDASPQIKRSAAHPLAAETES